MLIAPHRYGKLFPFIAAGLTLIGIVLHCASAQSVDGAAGVLFNFTLLILTVPVLLCMAFPSHRGLLLSSFFIFFSVYFLFSGIARFNAAILNPDLEIYQNYSDAATLFELSTDGTDLDSEGLSRITDTRGALKVFRIFYQLIHDLGLSMTPSIGVTLNAVVVAAGSAISMIGAKQLFPNSVRTIQVVATFFATSGLAYLFAGLHLRDSFLYLLNALLFIVLLRINFKETAKSVLPHTAAAAGLVFLMMIFRSESIFILFGFIATVVFEMIIQKDKVTRVVLFLVLGILMATIIQYFLTTYADLIELTTKTYREIQGESGGLAATLIINVPNWVRPIVGTPYMILGHIPFFAGFLLHESYYWFVSIQAVQALIVLPAFLYFIATYSSSKASSGPDAVRRLFIFYLIMSMTISVSTISYRHMGQFLPYLYIISAIGYVASSRAYRWISGFVLAVPVSLLWVVMKY